MTNKENLLHMSIEPSLIIKNSPIIVINRFLFKKKKYNNDLFLFISIKRKIEIVFYIIAKYKNKITKVRVKTFAYI